MSIVEQIRDYWDTDSVTYDRTATHRPTSAAEQSAWAAALARLLPPPPARVLDCGAGTGFLSLLAARLGHKVTSVDISAGMLDQLRARAASEGLGVDVIEGSAIDPPGGPYDAVIERHLLWTLPDPVAALRAWRGVAPVGRLILVEGVWGDVDPVESLRSRGRRLVRHLRGTVPEHHGEYSDEVRAALPFGRGTHPSAVVQAVSDAGWPDPWLERLRDVEWAASVGLPLAERLFGVSPRFVVTAG
jgi:SAM-dependent methyltransferase